jgi:aconitate decarboxylase
MSVTKKIAGFVSSLEYKDLSSEVVDHLYLCLLDTLGCGMYGSRLPWGQKLVKAISGMTNDNGSEGVGIFGNDCSKFSPDHAALINGTLIHSFEYDDLHKTAVIHPGAEVIPVLLALGEYMVNKGETVTGEQFITALAAGYEVGCQVGMVTGSEQLARGFHPSATSGVFGAAAAGAKLLNLNEEQTLHAIGTAGTQASGLMSAQYEAMAKRMNPGKSAQSGVMSALLAREGFTGITNVLEAEYGGFASVFAGRSIELGDFEHLGKEYEILNVGFKPYPCCGSNHTSIDSIMDIIKDRGGSLDAASIESIEIESTTATKHHVGWDYKPSGTIGAQMNLAYAVAVTTLDGVCSVEQYTDERIASEDVNAFIQKINITSNEGFDELGREGRHQIRLTVKFRNGEAVTKEKKHAKGSMFFPLSPREVEEKFTNQVAKLYGAEQAEKKLNRIKSVYKMPDIRALFDGLQEV